MYIRIAVNGSRAEPRMSFVFCFTKIKEVQVYFKLEAAGAFVSSKRQKEFDCEVHDSKVRCNRFLKY